MGRQWSAGKLVLILDAVHWNPEAPPRTLPRVRLRCGKAPPCCASSQLRRVSLVILIKPLTWCLACQLVDGSFSPRSMKKGEVSWFFRRTGSEALCRGGGTGKETAPKKEMEIPNASPRPTRCANLSTNYVSSRHIGKNKKIKVRGVVVVTILNI